MTETTIDNLHKQSRMSRRYERYAKEAGNQRAEDWNRQRAEELEGAVKALQRVAGSVR